MNGSVSSNFGRGSVSLARSLALGLSFCVASLVLSPSGAVPAELPKAEEVLARISEHSKARQQQIPRYEFTRTKLTQIADGDGKVESSEEEIYRMLPVAGTHYAKLISKDGKALSEAQRLKQQEDERKSREQPKAGRGRKDDSMFNFLDAKTAERFEYEVIGREENGERAAYLLSIKPRKDIPVHGIAEKVMARMEGRFWVDAEDWEVRRVEARLTKPFRFVFGAVGVLHEFQFAVERRRLEDGEWANSEVRVRIHFRELFETKTVTYSEVGTDYTLTGSGRTASIVGDRSRP